MLFQFIVELLIKFVPVTVNVKVLAPAVVLAGDKVVTVGVGLEEEPLPQVKTAALEFPPPGDAL